MSAAYDEAVERVRVATQRGLLRRSTEPGWLTTARTVLHPLRDAIRSTQRGDFAYAESQVARAWQSIAWAFEDVDRMTASLSSRGKPSLI